MPPTAAAPHRMRRSATTVDVVIGGTHTLVIEPSAGRVRVGMVMPGIHHLVDVSAHPAAATSAVQASATANCVTEEGAEAKRKGRSTRWRAPLTPSTRPRTRR